MSLYNDTLFTMRGRVKQVKPNADPTAIRDFINDRIRYLIDSQPFWADLVKRGVLGCPQAYATGQVSLTTNSPTVTGSATAWPVNNVSNTTIPSGVREFGAPLQVAPASMAGIAVDSFLYIDSGGDPEAVAVLETTNTTFTANFLKRHNANCTVTQSSLAGLQIKLGAFYPVFTVRAIHSATELEIDIPWGGAPLTAAAYQIVKAYFSIAPDLKDIIALWDPTQGRPLAYHKSREYINIRDPQRTATGFPICLADWSPSESGSMQYELWPHQLTPYQIPILYARQWPVLKNPTDRPPFFINPSVIIDGAIADALRVNNQMMGSEQADPFFNPRLADTYELKFKAGMEAAHNANQSKAQTELENWRNFTGYMPGGSWWQSHIGPDAWGDWGGDSWY